VNGIPYAMSSTTMKTYWKALAPDVVSEEIESTMEEAPPAAPKKKVPPMKAAKNLKKPDPQKPKATPKQQADAAKMEELKNFAMKTLKTRVESEPKKFPKLAAMLGVKVEQVETDSDNLHEVSPPSGTARRFSEDPKVKADYKKRYGKRWKEVLYATAWKMYKQGS
jgi:hypothetical protein